jgi:hypothetical protein
MDVGRVPAPAGVEDVGGLVGAAGPGGPGDLVEGEGHATNLPQSVQPEGHHSNSVGTPEILDGGDDPLGVFMGDGGIASVTEEPSNEPVRVPVIDDESLLCLSADAAPGGSPGVVLLEGDSVGDAEVVVATVGWVSLLPSLPRCSLLFRSGLSILPRFLVDVISVLIGPLALLLLVGLDIVSVLAPVVAIVEEFLLSSLAGCFFSMRPTDVAEPPVVYADEFGRTLPADESLLHGFTSMT